MRRGDVGLADAGATHRLGLALATVLAAGDVVALAGPLGAGKTTFARGVLHGLGLEGEVPSPSFPLVIDYAPPEVRLPLWHVDLYRLSGPAEARELGLDEARADAVLVIEWPERLGADLWPQALRLALHASAEGRRLTWEAPAPWEGRWPPPCS